jgi:hypothetical protein
MFLTSLIVFYESFYLLIYLYEKKLLLSKDEGFFIFGFL